MKRMAMSAHFDHIRGEEGKGGEPSCVKTAKTKPYSFGGSAEAGR